jgi:gamma-glutamyltranspeptidase
MELLLPSLPWQLFYPNAGNLGGGGFTVAKLSDGKEIAIDYREMATGQRRS